MKLDTKYTVDIDGVGRFIFRVATTRDVIEIRADMFRMLKGTDGLPESLVFSAEVIAMIDRLLVEPPSGFDLASLNPWHEETYTFLSELYGGMQKSEGRFREGIPSLGRRFSGEGKQEPGDLVSEEIQPDA